MGHLNTASEPALDTIRRALSGLRYGTVEIVVHDSKIVQIERHEKVRLLPENGPRNESPHAVGAAR